MTEARFRISRVQICIAAANLSVNIICLFVACNLVLTNDGGWARASLLLVIVSSFAMPFLIVIFLLKIGDYKKAVQKLKRVEEMKEGISDGTN